MSKLEVFIDDTIITNDPDTVLFTTSEAGAYTGAYPARKTLEDGTKIEGAVIAVTEKHVSFLSKEELADYVRTLYALFSLASDREKNI